MGCPCGVGEGHWGGFRTVTGGKGFKAGVAFGLGNGRLGVNTRITEVVGTGTGPASSRDGTVLGVSGAVGVGSLSKIGLGSKIGLVSVKEFEDLSEVGVTLVRELS